MGDIQQSSGPSNQSITITISALANNAMREGNAIDNSVNKFTDILLSGSFTTGGTGFAAGSQANIYIAGSADGGASFAGGATGSNAGFGSGSGQSVKNLLLVGSVDVPASSTTYHWSLWFYGPVPDSWVPVVENKSGSGAISGSMFYQGYKAEAV